MNFSFPYYVLIAVVLLSSFVYADDASEIKLSIPAATSISTKDYEFLLRSPKKIEVSDFEQSSLTAFLLNLKPAGPNSSKELREEFDSDGTAIIRPIAVLEELARKNGVNGKKPTTIDPITFIHADRITNFTCEMNGDTAKGTVTFRLPKIMKGKFDYVAKEKEWHISEILLPAHKIHLVRGDSGKWVKK